MYLTDDQLRILIYYDIRVKRLNRAAIKKEEGLGELLQLGLVDLHGLVHPDWYATNDCVDVRLTELGHTMLQKNLIRALPMLQVRYLICEETKVQEYFKSLPLADLPIFLIHTSAILRAYAALRMGNADGTGK